MADALNQYGPTFQIKLLSALLKSNEFTSTIIFVTILFLIRLSTGLIYQI